MGMSARLYSIWILPAAVQGATGGLFSPSNDLDGKCSYRVTAAANPCQPEITCSWVVLKGPLPCSFDPEGFLSRGSGGQAMQVDNTPMGQVGKGNTRTVLE
jgi:hypothetical protein